METDYISFVEEQVTKWKSFSHLIRNSDNEVSPSAVNKALAEYHTVELSLIAEYERYKKQYEIEREKFNMWWDEIFTKARLELNPISLPGTKWASKGEIESYARVQAKEMFLPWKQKLLELQAQVSFFKRLLDSWARVDKILVTLSNNMRTEMKSLSTVDRANNIAQRKPVHT